MGTHSSPNVHPRNISHGMVWDTGTLAWIAAVPGGGGAGGPATIIDGGDVTQGAKADVAWVSGDGTVISILKKIAGAGASSGLTDTQLRATPVPVSGTFWQVTQPVSGTVAISTALNLEATQLLVKAKTDNLDVALSTRTKPADQQHAIIDSGVITTVSAVTAITNALPAGSNIIGHVIVDTAPTTAVTGTFWQVTQPVSIASMPSTPVTGTFWQVTQPVSIASMPSTPVTGTFWQATQPISATSLPLPTGAALDTSLVTLHTDLAALEADIEESKVTPGSTTAPVTLEIVGGKTSDTTPQYLAVPLTEGGLAVPVRNSLLEVQGRLTNYLLGQSLLIQQAQAPCGFVPFEQPAFLTGL